jgi:hypothetical protein
MSERMSDEQLVAERQRLLDAFASLRKACLLIIDEALGTGGQTHG